MTRDPTLYVDDILKSIALIESYVADMTEEDFGQNNELQDAVARRLEIIGEAVKNIPAAMKTKTPDIPWKAIAGMRDMISHSYFSIDSERIWKVVVRDLPAFKKQLGALSTA